MTNTFIQTALLRSKNKKRKNGFTLIELMVVVAIVGILSAVGLPELTKAQNRAKQSTAIATLTNAAKECSLSLIATGTADEFTPGNFKVGENETTGDCEAGGTLSLTSEDGTDYEVSFLDSEGEDTTIPGAVTEAAGG